MNDASAPDAPAGLRLLLVDDDPLSTRFLAHLAALLGHRCAVTTDPLQALEQAANGAFDVLLLDLEMPGIDGFEALRRLRADEAAAGRPPLPVVAVTGYTGSDDRLRCLMAGFNEHLGKPIHVTALNQALRAVAQPAVVAGAATSDAERLRDAVQRLANMKPFEREFAPSVVETFALRSAQLIEQLQQAWSGPAQAQAAADAARALATSAEFLGALRLAGMSTEFATRCQAAGADELRERVHTIESEHQAVLTVLFARPR